MLVSAPWGSVDPPHKSHASTDDDAVPAAIVHARPSVLFAIEPERLSLVTAQGAPFKVPLSRISFVWTAQVGDALLCDLVHGAHTAGGKRVVETVRLDAGALDFDRLLDERTGDPASDFDALVGRLSASLEHARQHPGNGDARPRFHDLDTYENELIRLFVGEE